MKRLLKIIGIFLLSILVILGIAFVIMNAKYSSELPKGETGEKADLLAQNILTSLNYEDYQNTSQLSWKFRDNTYQWNKNTNEVLVSWEGNTVLLYTKDTQKSIIKSPLDISDTERQQLITDATNAFYNDSFWLVAPYKIMEQGVTRKYVAATETENASLLITYSSGGSTPGDSYQWFVDENYIPTKFKMWASIVPIDGLTATWADWKETGSGAKISHSKTLIDLMEIPISEIKTSK